MSKPALVLFDVNETLSDLEPLRGRFTEIGAPGELFELWFASTLRDGFALASAGAYADFRSVATGVLLGLLAKEDALRRKPADAAEFILQGFEDLDIHRDVRDGVRTLAEANVRLATLTNGSAALTERLLERAGLAEFVERYLSVDAVQRWKPAAEAYRYALRELGARPDECVLVAVHPWDIDGAKRAGLRAGWLDRGRTPYPDVFARPDAIGTTLGGLADALLAS